MKYIEESKTCSCRACNPYAWWIVVCHICGNKRCPHAEDHKYECFGKNDLDQPKILKNKKNS